jgi:hypothetical protein
VRPRGNGRLVRGGLGVSCVEGKRMPRGTIVALYISLNQTENK